MAMPVFYSGDKGPVIAKKLNEFAGEVAKVQGDAAEVAQAVLDAQMAAGESATSAGEASGSAGAAAADRAGAEEARDEARYISDTILQQIDLQTTLARVARYGIDVPHPGIDNQFAGARMLDPHWAFSRPGEGYVVGPSGLLEPRGPNVPRFQYDPLTGAPEGLLIEPQDTNINYNNTSPAGLTPTNGMQLEQLTGGPTGSFFRLTAGESGSQRLNVAGPDSSTYPRMFAQGIFRAGTHRYAAIGGSTTLSRYAVYDLIDGVVTRFGTGITGAGMRHLGGGWWWCWAWRTPEQTSTNSTAPGGSIAFGVATGAGTAGEDVVPGTTIDVLLPGARTESVYTPMMPIATAGAMVTRPADTMYCDMQQVPGFSPTRGAFVVEWTDMSLAGAVLTLTDNMTTLSNMLSINRSSSGGILRCSMRRDLGSTEFVNLGFLPAPTRHRVAFRFDGASVTGSLDGATPVTLTPAAGWPTGLRYLQVGRSAHGIYRRAPWYPYPLTDAQLQAMSAL